MVKCPSGLGDAPTSTSRGEDRSVCIRQVGPPRRSAASATSWPGAAVLPLPAESHGFGPSGIRFPAARIASSRRSSQSGSCGEPSGITSDSILRPSGRDPGSESIDPLFVCTWLTRHSVGPRRHNGPGTACRCTPRQGVRSPATSGGTGGGRRGTGRTCRPQSTTLVVRLGFDGATT